MGFCSVLCSSFLRDGEAINQILSRRETAIGRVSADYYTYIGPFDHNVLSLFRQGISCFRRCKVYF